MARLLSGRVGVTSYAGLSTERQQTNGFPSFHSLEETEPNLGLPSNNDFVLHGDVNGRTVSYTHLTLPTIYSV